ncbi:uncharacterized protein LOC141606485 [Silene latifolia]|uniref:uncharacterized protein LOC141606485 n=1 Tax=Silene latifolia TaxID=37657 RepID=UPI003D7711E4
MAPPPRHHHHHHYHQNNHQNHNHITTFLQTTASNITTFLTPKTTPSNSPPKTTPSHLFLPLPLPPPLLLPFSESTPNDPPALRSKPDTPGSGFPSMVRIGGLKSTGRTGTGLGSSTGGPAFVGQVFSMCDLTGTGLMAVSSHFDIPFFSQRAPEWMKKMLSSVVKNESGPVFRFFMDLGDAVSYVKKLNIPSGIVGSCRLDLAYEHFKEKPHLFQFVPNAKQVKAASKLLNGNKKTNGRSIDGVPVFSAQNLDIAIATPEGVKWYTPYFFDKSVLDNILEESVDQHFHSLIQSRYMQRRGDVIDDSFPAEVIEESADSLWESTEVQELMDEMGQSGIPLSVISKAAEMQLLYAADKVLLGNRWLRKATGIQPKFPYIVDSFERRSAVSWSKVAKLGTSTNPNMESKNKSQEHSSSVKPDPENEDQGTLLQQADHSFPLGDWLRPPWMKKPRECKKEADTRTVESPGYYTNEELKDSPLLPRITMVGIATTEPGQMSKATVKKTMEDLSKELEQEGRGSSSAKTSSEKYSPEDRDPLFVANVGDYNSNMGKTSSPRWLRGIHS